jgi:hypothetical protein
VVEYWNDVFETRYSYTPILHFCAGKGGFRKPVDTRANLGKTNSRPMNSERQKREEEIERLMRGVELKQEPDAVFQERLKKAASDIIAEETSRIQKTERPERRKGSFSLKTAGLWLLVVGAVLSFYVPGVGAMVLLCGIDLIAWTALGNSSKTRNDPPASHQAQN